MGTANNVSTSTLSGLWQHAFAPRSGDDNAEARVFFREQLLSLRKKAVHLVAQTAKDIPHLTVHDITHSDALWEIAGIIAGPEYRLNPVEAYVFGAAVLLHDAAMSLAAYPNGLADIQLTDEWRDAVASLRNDPERQQPSNGLELGIVIREVLRVLHAKHAAELPTAKWRTASGFEYLIDDPRIRSHYGPVIGRIARSHNDPVTSLLGTVGNEIGAFDPAPSEWAIDPVKLAGLLRCADAAHIDHRRAPGFLRLLVKPERISELHWAFQEKIAKPVTKGEALLFTSGSDFCLEQADAWWLCFETVRIIDRELHDVDRMFESAGRSRFAIRRVVGAESPAALADHVRTKGWEPVDAQLKVSDVRQIVTLFGGKHLYGNDDLVPIRELIQNGADAIRARRLLQPGFFEHEKVTVSVRDVEDSFWLSVEDNGIGMSRRTLTDSLLDFGRSFWTSGAVKDEFPGLMGKGLSPTGLFGIGFFSVFMLGDTVHVTSRRYDASLSSALTMEFRSGVELRPIVRPATDTETLPLGGTRVSVLLKKNPFGKGGFLARPRTLDFTKFELPKLDDIEEMDLCEIVARSCPSIDVSLQTARRGVGFNICVAAGDWLRIDAYELLNRIGPGSSGRIRDYAPLVRALTDGGQVYGRACITGITEGDIGHGLVGVVTVGGFIASRLFNIAGILQGTTSVITRQSARPEVPTSVLRGWAAEQAVLISNSSLPAYQKLLAAAVVLRLGADPSSLPIATRGGEYLNASQIKEQIANFSEVIVYEQRDVSYDEDKDHCHPKEFAKHFEQDPNIFFVTTSRPNLSHSDWPETVLNDTTEATPTSCLHLLQRTINLAWGVEPEEWDSEQVVGSVASVEITRSVSVFVKPEAERSGAEGDH